MLSAIQSFDADKLRSTTTHVKSLCEVLRVDPTTVRCRPRGAHPLASAITGFEKSKLSTTETHEKSLSDVFHPQRTELVDDSIVVAPPDDVPVPDVPMSAPVEAMHGRCYGFEVERATWDAPRMISHCSAEARPGYNSMSKSEYVDTDATLRAKVRQLARLLRQARHPVFYCGAGLSTAAGIGDYASSNTAAHAGKEAPSLATALKEKIASKEVGGSSSFKSPLCAQPTLAHRVLTALHGAGRMHRLVQQNHDGLPQKAGLPQSAINEIHGACHDPSNPVVPMNGELRGDLFADLLACEEGADLGIAVGTSLCGMNADRVVTTAAERAASRKQRERGALGSVVIGLQRTVHDPDATLRLFGRIDAVFALLAEEMGLAVAPARAEGEYFHPPVLSGAATTAAEAAAAEEAVPACWKEAALLQRGYEHGQAYLLRGLRYDAAGRRVETTGSGSGGGSGSLDVRDGAQLVIPIGMHAGAVGEVDGCDREGNPRCRFKLKLRRDKPASFKAPHMMPLGTWHLQAAADAAVDRLPVVNVPAEDDESEAAREVRALIAAYA